MKKIISLIFLLALIAAAFTTCGESGTGVSNPPTAGTTKQTASAAAALFGNDENASLSAAGKIPLAVLDRLIKNAQAQTDGNQQNGNGEGGCGEDDPTCTCTSIGSNEDHPGIADAAFASAGTYGSADNPVTLDADDFCELSDGTSNTGSGPDGKGLFAGFTIVADVTGTCTDDSGSTTIAFKGGSAGVWRNTLQDGATPAYEPQVYGTFVMEIGGSEVQIDCTMFLLEDESVAFADCSDENGEMIEQDTDANCSFQE